MNDEHIMSVKSNFNSFNANCGLNTKTHFSTRKIVMNWNVRNDWYNGKKIQDKQ
jgi:hypothetical protein